MMLLTSTLILSSCSLTPRSLSLLFSALSVVHIVQLALVCSLSGQLQIPWHEIMTFFSIISSLSYIPLLSYSFCVSLPLRPAPFIFPPPFLQNTMSSTIDFGLLSPPPPPLSLSSHSRFEWKPVELKKQVWSCEEFTQWETDRERKLNCTYESARTSKHLVQ